MRFPHEIWRDGEGEIPVVVRCRTYYDDGAPGSLACPRGVFVEDVVITRINGGGEIEPTKDELDVINGIAASIITS